MTTETVGFRSIMVGIVDDSEGHTRIGFTMVAQQSVHVVAVSPDRAMAVFEQLELLLNNLGLFDEQEPEKGEDPCLIH